MEKNAWFHQRRTYNYRGKQKVTKRINNKTLRNQSASKKVGAHGGSDAACRRDVNKTHTDAAPYKGTSRENKPPRWSVFKSGIDSLAARFVFFFLFFFFLTQRLVPRTAQMRRQTQHLKGQLPANFNFRTNSNQFEYVGQVGGTTFQPSLLVLDYFFYENG